MSDEKHIESPAGQEETEAKSGVSPVAQAQAAEASHTDHDQHVGVEKESVNAGLVLGIVLGIVVIVTSLVLFAFTITESTSRETRARVVAEMGYPELREARAAAAALLTRYDVQNAQEGTFRIPIDRAIDLTVNEKYQNLEEGDYSEELNLLPSN